MDSSLMHGLADFLEELGRTSSLEVRFEREPEGDAERRAVAALNAFLDQLWLKDFQLSAKREMLEKVVEIRTKEVHEILDNVSSGFLIALADETVLDNFSRSCARIFESEDLKGRKITELMRLSERAADHFAACYGQIFDPDMPYEVSLSQLPTEFVLGEHSYRIEGSPILTPNGEVSKVFFTINDTTELRKAEAENALRRALLEIIRQRDGFRQFLFDTAHAVAEVRRNPTEHALRSLLHTTKGNLGCYGLHDLASLIHTMEDAPCLSIDDVTLVEDTLKKFLKTHQTFIGLEYPESRRSPRAVEMERLLPFLEQLELVDSATERQALTAKFVRTLQWAPAGALLAPLRGVVARVSERLGKSVGFEMRGERTLVDPDWTGPVLANLVHLVRNSLDHGIEWPRERGTKGPRGRVWVDCQDSERGWLVQFGDDGRGLDPEALARAAVQKGLIDEAQAASLSKEQKLELLFLEGVSTKEEATEVSGRGVGAGALRESIEEIGGRVRVESELGLGTTFFLELPHPPSVD